MRVSWDAYFLDIARSVATRSTCDRKHVGAVIVRNKVILSTGYNGSIRGLAHCDDAGHMMEDGHCVRTVHAEANAIVQAARMGGRVDEADLYTTASPCWPCFKLIVNSGIRRVVFGEFYRDERIFTVAAELGIELVEATSPATTTPSLEAKPVPFNEKQAYERCAAELEADASDHDKERPSRPSYRLPPSRPSESFSRVGPMSNPALVVTLADGGSNHRD